MAEAKISSERWVLDADLEGQKADQQVKVILRLYGLPPSSASLVVFVETLRA